MLEKGFPYRIQKHENDEITECVTCRFGLELELQCPNHKIVPLLISVVISR